MANADRVLLATQYWWYCSRVVKWIFVKNFRFDNSVVLFLIWSLGVTGQDTEWRVIWLWISFSFREPFHHIFSTEHSFLGLRGSWESALESVAIHTYNMLSPTCNSLCFFFRIDVCRVISAVVSPSTVIFIATALAATHPQLALKFTIAVSCFVMFQW